jgi:quercetin dioxygenase-like cupin family protein
MVESSSSESLLKVPTVHLGRNGHTTTEGRRTRTVSARSRESSTREDRGGRNKMLGNRTKWIVGVLIIAVSLALSGVAIATGATGSVVSVVLGAGSTDEKFEFRAKPDTNTVVASFTFGPNSSTGWHTHPGRTLVTIKSGTFTVYHAEDCAPMVYEPGDAFVELPSTVHVGRNETTGTVELGVVFFKVPIGGSPRIDQPQPENCDVT